MPADIQASFRRIVELIGSHGLERMREPYVKHLEGPLWEMRMKGKDGIARAAYVTATGRRVVVVHVFPKKTQKTPRREIKKALRRAKEVT
jgi:phage-related protein